MRTESESTRRPRLTVRDVDGIMFQRREWAAQRVGWLLVALALLAASLGLWGVGPLSATKASSADGSVTVSYQRFLRNAGTTTMTISLGSSTVVHGKTRLYISRQLAQSWQIQSVSPQPSTESSSGRWLIYEFEALGESAPAVKVVYQGDGVGHHTGVVRANRGDPLAVSQWTYP